jgi:uncharacterized Zn-binding protein involved in type VI secretion
MSRPLILLGDKTTHGGNVIGCSPISKVAGVGIARVGDAVICPLHGSTLITTGDATLVLQGQDAARLGDLTTCGASLLASQLTTHRP